MQSASKHEWVLFILKGTQALWKLALEHGSKWKWHHGPNEKPNAVYSSPPAQDLSPLSREWFGSTFSSWAQSLQGWDVSCPCFPSLAGNESLSHSGMPWYPATAFCQRAHLYLSFLLSLTFGVLTIMVCKQPKPSNECTVFVGLVCFWANQNFERFLCGEGSLGHEASTVRTWRRESRLQIG